MTRRRRPPLPRCLRRAAALPVALGLLLAGTAPVVPAEDLGPDAPAASAMQPPLAGDQSEADAQTDRAAHKVPWWTMDAGGGRSTGAAGTLGGTVGQLDACSMAGGGVTLHGGFWTTAAEEIFADGFESGTAAAWSGSVQ